MSQSDERNLISAARTMAATAEQGVLASAVAWICDVDITYSQLVSLSLAPRTATFSIPKAKVGDRVYVHPRARATLAGANVLSGILLQSTGLVGEDGKVEVYHVIPAVGLSQTLIIPLRLVGQRPAVA